MKINEYPDVVNLRGELVSSDDVATLDQDILEVELSNGVFIDVGWYPEHDVDGQFHIRVFLEAWENQLLVEPISTKDHHEAERIVKQLISHFSGPLISQSLSSTLDIVDPVTL